MACAGQFILGVAFSAFGPIKDTLVQIHTPLDRIGRVNAAMGAGNNLAGPSRCSVYPLLPMSWACRNPLRPPGCWWSSPLAILIMRGREIGDLVDEERAREAGCFADEGPRRGVWWALATTASLGAVERPLTECRSAAIGACPHMCCDDRAGCNMGKTGIKKV